MKRSPFVWRALVIVAVVWAVTAMSGGVSLVHSKADRSFTVEIGPVDLPSASSASHVHTSGAEHVHSAAQAQAQSAASEHSHANAVLPPIAEVKLPVDGYLHEITVSVIDDAGREVPRDLIHHVNFIDPGNRELFLPISQRMAAMGKETGSVSIPRMLFGYPIRTGQTMVVAAVLHNPHPRDYLAVTVKVKFSYSPVRRPWPLFSVYPFQLDVLFPHGDKSFDLPPGRSARSYEARPSVGGRIVALSGHVHEYATSIKLTDVASGKVIWEGRPILDASGKVTAMPVSYFVNRLGIKLSPQRTYRVSVEYDNPTAEVIKDGGMGVIGGAFMPRMRSRWPKADAADPTYDADRAHYMRLAASTR